MFNTIFAFICIIVVVFRGPCAARVTPLEEVSVPNTEEVSVLNARRWYQN